jgi:uncharacterized protein (TIGR00369 family)
MGFKQPNSRMCFVCGLENAGGLCLHFYDDGRDTVWSQFVIADQHQGFPGVVHGGISAAILDEVGCRTMMIGAPERFGMTAKLELRYREPVPQGVPLKAIGRLIKDRGRLVSAEASIQTLDGRILTEATVLVADLPPGKLHLDQVDVLGWRVYPDPAGEPTP